MDTATLIAQAPAEILLGLALFFTVASLSLLALSIEADNYPELLQFHRYLWRALDFTRPRRRWSFNRPRYCDQCHSRITT